MFRPLYIFLFLFFFTFLGHAETAPKYVSFYGGYGLSSIGYSPTIGKNAGGMGLNVGGDYSCFFTPKLGFSVGFNFSSYSGKFNSASDSLDHSAIDADGESFVFKNYFTNWEENQKAMTFGVPIMLRYRHVINEKLSLQGGLGLKIAFLVSSEQKQSSGSVRAKGYFPSLGVQFDSVPKQGFSSHQFTSSPTLSTSTNLSLVADALVNYELNSFWSCFGGLYLDYGLSNIAGKGEDGIVSYQATTSERLHYNGVLNSSAVSSASTMALGAKVGVTFNIGNFLDDRHAKAVEAARVKAENASVNANVSSKMTRDILAQAAQLNRQMKEQQRADSLKQVEIKTMELRQNAVQDSLLKQDRAKQLQDSISLLRNGGEGKVIMVIRTKELNQEELSMLQLPIDFDRGAAGITAEYRDNARKIGAILAKHSNLRIGITGHTCDLGAEDVNYKLGLQRANTLLDAFVEAGTDRNQITTASKGELEPMVPNVDEVSRQKNRRVVIVIEDAPNE